MKNNKLIFFSENPALKNKGSGISVLLYNILLATKEKNPQLITFCHGHNIKEEEIKNDNSGIDVHVCDKKLTAFYKIKGIKKLIIPLSFILNIRKIGQIINKPDNMVICLVGASSGPLWKFLTLKFLFGKAKHGLYIVDDLQLINRKLHQKIEVALIKKLLPKAIKSTDFLITISSGLQETYLTQYNKKSYILLPHFTKREPLPKYKPENSFTFLFTGGLSFLYNKPLLELSFMLNEINLSGKCDKDLKLQVQTYTSINEYNSLNFNPSTTFYSTVSNRDELMGIYNNCQCFIIPYSFDKEDVQIVKTSFPQKVAEIIQYQKPILIYGPAYSSVTQFFSQNLLNYICDVNDKQHLIDTILKIVNDSHSFTGEKYSEAYNEFLSVGMVNNLFNKISDDLIYGN